MDSHIDGYFIPSRSCNKGIFPLVMIWRRQEEKSRNEGLIKFHQLRLRGNTARLLEAIILISILKKGYSRTRSGGDVKLSLGWRRAVLAELADEGSQHSADWIKLSRKIPHHVYRRRGHATLLWLQSLSVMTTEVSLSAKIQMSKDGNGIKLTILKQLNIFTERAYFLNRNIKWLDSFHSFRSKCQKVRGAGREISFPWAQWLSKCHLRMNSVG